MTSKEVVIIKELIQLQSKLVPEILDITEKRYNILRAIEYKQPIGRRALAIKLNKSERYVRSELDLLKAQNLIDIDGLGMCLTDEGKRLVDDIRPFIAELKGLKNLEGELKAALGVKDVLIVPGNVEENEEVLREMGKTAFDYIEGLIDKNTIIAVSGGYSVLAVAEGARHIEHADVSVVPARGGLKTDLERQANAVAAKLAQNMGCSYHLLYLPDNISGDQLEIMVKDPDIQRVINDLANTDIFIFGLSSLEAISKKRNFTKEQYEALKALNAKAEAFGYYYDDMGKIVCKAGSLGITIDQLDKMKAAVSIGAGNAKAEPVILVNKGKKNNVIVTDEATAREIKNILQGGN